MSLTIMAKIGQLFMLITIAASVRSQLDVPLSGFNQFGLNLYKTVRDADPTQNLIISPLSIKTALGLLLMGANDTTAEEIVRGLQLDTSDLTDIASSFHDVLKTYSSGDLLKIVNKVYVAEEYEMKQRFSRVARDRFNSEAENVDFKDGLQAAETINSWVEDQTNHKIKDLLNGEEISADTLMVLVNAVHFKAAWDDPFQTSSTRQEDFWISETESVKVNMMRGISYAKFAANDELDAKVAFVPYKNKTAFMLLVVPNSRSGLDDLESKLLTYDFSRITEGSRNAWTHINLPKFKFENSVDLEGVLTKMGMGRMFTDDAEFPEIIETDKRIKVDKALHKTFISVDEEGTEAAAATSLKLIPQSAPPKIIADRPFFFAIISPNAVPFMGRFRMP